MSADMLVLIGMVHFVCTEQDIADCYQKKKVLAITIINPICHRLIFLGQISIYYQKKKFYFYFLVIT